MSKTEKDPKENPAPQYPPKEQPPKGEEPKEPKPPKGAPHGPRKQLQGPVLDFIQNKLAELRKENNMIRQLEQHLVARKAAAERSLQLLQEIERAYYEEQGEATQAP